MSTNGSAAPFRRPKLSWQPSPEDAWYYQTPVARENPLYTTFVRPWLGHSDDPTFARYDLPWSPREQALRSDPRWNVTERRAYLDGGASDKGKPRAWVFYQVRGLGCRVGWRCTSECTSHAPACDRLASGLGGQEAYTRPSSRYLLLPWHQ